MLRSSFKSKVICFAYAICIRNWKGGHIKANCWLLYMLGLFEVFFNVLTEDERLTYAQADHVPLYGV